MEQFWRINIRQGWNFKGRIFWTLFKVLVLLIGGTDSSAIQACWGHHCKLAFPPAQEHLGVLGWSWTQSPMLHMGNTNPWVFRLGHSEKSLSLQLTWGNGALPSSSNTCPCTRRKFLQEQLALREHQKALLSYADTLAPALLRQIAVRWDPQCLVGFLAPPSTTSTIKSLQLPSSFEEMILMRQRKLRLHACYRKAVAEGGPESTLHMFQGENEGFIFLCP